MKGIKMLLLVIGEEHTVNKYIKIKTTQMVIRTVDIDLEGKHAEGILFAMEKKES